jgi:hypothetical protein
MDSIEIIVVLVRLSGRLFLSYTTSRSLLHGLGWLIHKISHSGTLSLLIMNNDQQGVKLTG